MESLRGECSLLSIGFRESRTLDPGVPDEPQIDHMLTTIGGIEATQENRKTVKSAVIPSDVEKCRVVSGAVLGFESLWGYLPFARRIRP